MPSRRLRAIQRGLDRFGDMLDAYDQREEYTREIKDLENEADDIAHEIFRFLGNTFITPFDREDIQLLANRLDDVIDLVEATAARMEIYDLPDPPEEVREMSRILRHAFKNVAEAIGMLRNPKQREEIQRLCVEVNRLENEGDAVLRLSLRRLFQDARDPLHVIKMKEIYENLEEAVDRCEDLADVIETILIKNA